MKKVIVTKGLPASGKTTWAKAEIAANPNTVRVNKDDLREMMHNGIHSKGREALVLKVRDFIIESALKEGHHVIVDDTNFNPYHVTAIRQIAKKYNAEVGVLTFDTPLEVCIDRDKNRAKSVGEEVIRSMYNKYVNNKFLDGVDPSRIWITTDTHFNHEMLIREGIRPADYNEQIVTKWNEKITEDDYVIHLGDVIFGDKSKLKEILDRLNGHKVLVKGNHDFKPDEWFIEQGFERVVDSFIYRNLLFTHIPSIDVPHDIVYNIHGHLHNSTHRLEEVSDILTPKHKLIALENTDYQPINLNGFIVYEANKEKADVQRVAEKALQFMEGKG